jgi:hypothetical protein
MLILTIFINALYSSTQVFIHAIAILNPRLIISEVISFLALLATELSIHNTPFIEGLVEAYCRDESVGSHTDLLWLTGGYAPMVLRDASGHRFGGLRPPHLCVPGCKATTPRIKRGRQQLIWVTQCCKVTYRVSIPAGVALPEEKPVGGRAYVLVEWPGDINYTVTRLPKDNP